MWFKNISLFRLPKDFKLDTELVESKLGQSPLKPCGPLELLSEGFVSPFTSDGGAFSWSGSRALLCVLGSEVKVLPGPVIRKALKEKIRQYQDKQGRVPGKKIREQLKDEVLQDLLPRAFTRPQQTMAYLDDEARWLVVDSASDKVAEGLLSRVREALGSLAAEPAAAEESLTAVMTDWLLRGEAQAGFVLGSEVQLKDPVDSKSTVKFANHDLSLEEVREHVRQGKRVSQLGLVFDNRIGLTLDEKLKLRKLKFLDDVQDELEDSSGEDANAAIDARMTLMVLELRRMLSALDSVFKLG
jgi:recombination associated protein RdgC